MKQRTNVLSKKVQKMQGKCSKGVIQSQTKQLINDIKVYSVSQKKLWQKLPYLACMANGRTGWNDNLTRAMQNGFWALEPSVVNGHYTIFVDLETGRFMNPWDLTKNANDDNVLLLANRLDELNVQDLVNDLKEKTREPYGTYYSVAVVNETETNRKKWIKEYELKPNTYKRKKSIKQIQGQLPTTLKVGACST